MCRGVFYTCGMCRLVKQGVEHPTRGQHNIRSIYILYQVRDNFLLQQDTLKYIRKPTLNFCLQSDRSIHKTVNIDSARSSVGRWALTALEHLSIPRTAVVETPFHQKDHTLDKRKWQTLYTRHTSALTSAPLPLRPHAPPPSPNAFSVYLVGVVGVDGHERVHLRVLVKAQQPEAVEVREALVALVDQHHSFPVPI